MVHQLATANVGHFIDWGFVHLSVGNLVVIVTMLVVFVLAIVVPFPRPHDEEVRELPPPPPGRTEPPGSARERGGPR